jgi:two-component system CheB/CheR fusion protein
MTAKQSAARTRASTANFPVVGIGASAGGVQALQELFGNLAADTGMAFVVILHLSSEDQSNLPQLLAKQTAMPVQTAKEGQALAPNQVFIIPPNRTLTLQKRTLRLSERDKASGKFKQIDRFFESLAEQLVDQALGVILSGAGADGALGIEAIKAAGGLTFAQSEASAQFPEMPRNAIQSGQIDLIMTPAQIAAKLADLVRHPHLANFRRLATEAPSGWERIQRLLKNAGIDFSQYKQSTIRRRISRRMALHRVEELSDYAALLQANPREIKALREDLLIKVTKVFRNPETFESLENLKAANEELTKINLELQSRNEDLSQAHNDLNNLIRSVQIPFLIVNDDLRIRRISDNAPEALLITPGDIGRPLTEFKLSFDFPDLEQTLREVMHAGLEVEREVQDRKGRWNLLRLSPYRTERQGENLGAVLALFDIDRFKHSLEETERAFSYALRIVDTIKDPLLVLDESLRVKKANPAFYQKFQVSPLQTEGRTVYQLGEGQWDRPELRRLLLEILPQSAQLDNFPVEFDFPLLGPRTMLLSARQMKADTSPQTTILLSILDVTEQKQAEDYLRRAKQAAEEASRAKGEFLANMSHEIRTPLTVILGVLELLRSEELDQERARCLELAETASQSLLELIGDILDFSKIEAQQLTLEYQPFCLRDCLEEVTLLLRDAAQRKGLQLQLQVAPELPGTQLGDRNRLRQVLTNLIGNAIKFSETGIIRVKAGLRSIATPAGNSGECLLFRVSDRGPGIPASKMGLLFHSFSQLDASISRRHGGSGLGLAISKGIVERMGGEIWAESQEGVGSDFFFTLPIRPERRKTPRSGQAPLDQAASPDASRCRILLAEDDPALQAVMRLVLTGQGWEVEIVTDGRAAIAAWERGGFGLILMDLQMSGMDGLSAARHIRSREAEDQRIPIIALTANAQAQARRDCLQAGMDELLVKPPQVAVLRAMVERYCT